MGVPYGWSLDEPHRKSHWLASGYALPPNAFPDRSVAVREWAPNRAPPDPGFPSVLRSLDRPAAPIIRPPARPSALRCLLSPKIRPSSQMRIPRACSHPVADHSARGRGRVRREG